MASQKVHLMDITNSVHTLGTQHTLIELILSLIWTGMMTHGVLPHGVKTTGMAMIGLNHGVNVADGHGRIPHLRVTYHLRHH